MERKINAEYGLLYPKNMDIEPYLISEIKDFQLLSNKTAYAQEKRKKVLLIHSVGKFCQGSCTFCISVQERKEEKMDVDKLEKYIDENINLFEKEINIAFTGGEPLNFYKPIVDMLVTKFTRINLTFFTALFVSDHLFEKFKKHLVEFEKNEKINNIRLCVSVDYGSDLRKADLFSMDSDDILTRSTELGKLFEMSDTFHIQLYNVFTNKYDFEKINNLFDVFNHDKNLFSSITYNMLREDENNAPSYDNICELYKLVDDKISFNDILLTRFSYVTILGEKYKRGTFKYLDGQKLKLVELDDNVYKVFAGNFCPMYSGIQLSLDPSMNPGGCFHLYDVYKTQDASVYNKCDTCSTKGVCGYCGYFRTYCVEHNRLYSDYLQCFVDKLESRINSGFFDIKQFVI